MVVRVIRVETIPFSLSALFDEQPDGLIVWLLESDWPEARARLIEQVLRALCVPRGQSESAVQPDLHAV